MSTLSPSLHRALEEFRQEVLKKNHTTLSLLVGRLEHSASSNLQPSEDICAAVLETLRDEYFHREMPSALSLEKPCDILNPENFAILAEHFGLDGTARGDVDAGKREQWLARLRGEMSRLQEQSEDEAEWPEDLPADLKALILNVRGIWGPGLPYWLARGRTSFFSSQLGLESAQKTRKRVFVPLRNSGGQGDELDIVWEEWDIAVAVKLGQGGMSASAMLAIFCKFCEEGSKESTWQWRFGVCDEDWSSQLYVGVEEFLAWFAEYEEQTEKDVEEDLVEVGKVALPLS